MVDDVDVEVEEERVVGLEGSGEEREDEIREEGLGEQIGRRAIALLQEGAGSLVREQMQGSGVR